MSSDLSSSNVSDGTTGSLETVSLGDGPAVGADQRHSAFLRSSAPDLGPLRPAAAVDDESLPVVSSLTHSSDDASSVAFRAAPSLAPAATSPNSVLTGTRAAASNGDEVVSAAGAVPLVEPAAPDCDSQQDSDAAAAAAAAAAAVRRPADVDPAAAAVASGVATDGSWPVLLLPSADTAVGVPSAAAAAVPAEAVASAATAAAADRSALLTDTASSPASSPASSSPSSTPAALAAHDLPPPPPTVASPPISAAAAAAAAAPPNAAAAAAPAASPAAGSGNGKPMFDHFIVVGLPQDEEEYAPGALVEPRILFHYPPDRPLTSLKVEHFCFPEQIKVATVRRTPSCSQLNKLLYAQSYHLDPAHYPYMFRLAGEDSTYYGICIARPEVLRDTPSFFEDFQEGSAAASEMRSGSTWTAADSHPAGAAAAAAVPSSSDLRHAADQRPSPAASLATPQQQQQQRPVGDSSLSPISARLGRKDNYVVAPRCYCIISQHPFFSLHLDVLTMILAQDRLIRSTRTLDQILLADHPLPNDSEKDATQHIRRILEAFRDTTVPQPGQSIEFRLPGELKAKSFFCPLGDEEAKLVADWVLVTTFSQLSLDNVLVLLAALLTEHRIVLHSANLFILSSVALSVIPLLRPFRWQGLLIPILPYDLKDMLQAPVPFITGVQRLDQDGPPGPIEGVIVHLDSNIVECRNVPPPPLLPEFKKLQHNLRVHYDVLTRSQLRGSPAHPLTFSAEYRRAAQSLLDGLQGYIGWLIGKVKGHYQQSNLFLHSSHNRDLLNRSLIASVSPPNRPFMTQFLNAQHFSVFAEQLCQQLQPNKPASPQAAPTLFAADPSAFTSVSKQPQPNAPK